MTFSIMFPGITHIVANDKLSLLLVWLITSACVDKLHLVSSVISGHS